jgi:hypothetical protein
MPPATRSAEREEERRLNTRTLTIASVASATAAAVTSQLWIAGTWIAAAFTPVLVALISEALHRPTERVARAWTAERDVSRTERRASSATRGEPVAVTGSTGPVRVYRQTSRGVTEPERGRAVLFGRRVPWRAVLVTALAAFVIAVAAITAIDLVSGGSVGKGSGGTTFFRSGSSAKSGTDDGNEGKQPAGQQDSAPKEQQPSQEQAPAEQQPSATETTPSTPQSDTAPVAPPTDGSGNTTP